MNQYVLNENIILKTYLKRQSLSDARLEKGERVEWQPR